MAQEITKSYQIVCEGRADVEFFAHLIRHRGIDRFNVSCPQDIKGQCIGKSGFVQRLLAFRAIVDPPQRGVIVVADSDTDANAAFAYACDHFRQAEQYPIPTAPLEIAQAAGQPCAAVLLIPGGERQGHIDSLLLDCVGLARPELAPHVDRFCTDTGIGTWNQPEIDRAKLRLTIAASYPRNPGISLAFWVQDKNRPFEYSHSAFNVVADFLTRFLRDC